uniref:Bromodomain associated domain-containing protein n=1 Tax=Rhizophora mucronata TaxID=61149 RepID=A0A2P2JFZ0_RHIMU
MSLLGDDGKGFELARKLEAQGAWREWLGESLYSAFAHSMSSPASWESFMRADEPKSKTQIQLQLRARALLFDKASVSLFLHSNATSSVAVSNLSPTYLQLHGDDVYFTLEDGDQRREVGGGVGHSATSSKSNYKSTYRAGQRYAEHETDNLSQRFRSEELPEIWYNQFIEKYKISRPSRLSLGDLESDKRSPEQMTAYLRHVERHKRRHVAFRQDQYMGFGNSATSNMPPSSVLDGSSFLDDDIYFFPETMFMLNCVPDSALPPITRLQQKQKTEYRGVLEALPQARTPVTIERLGISVERGGSLHRGKKGSEGNRKLLSQEQALLISRKVVARMLTRVGFAGATEVPVEVFSQLLSCHILKLGRILKVLADSYRKQCSALELLKMFLQTAGYSNVGSLMELVKDGSRTMQPTQPQAHGVESQFQSQHQSPLQLPQQMQQMVHSPNPAIQQQHFERMRKRQPPTTRPGIDMDKDRPLVRVKLENPSELNLDNAFNPVHNRHPQMQFCQQQIAAMPSLHSQSSNQLRQLTSLQVPQMQTLNMGIVRAPPVKVEGFQELMGGDATFKHDSEENKLTSPTSK